MKLTPKALIFDVNETLLDLSPLKESINKALGIEYAADIWFAELLQYSLVETVSDSYHNFSQIAQEVLRMNALKYDLDLSKEELQKTLKPITSLKAYPDVMPGLEDLKSSGFKLIAYSNGKPDVLRKQLEFAEIDHFFDHIESVENVKKYKPHLDSYQYIVDASEVNKSDCMMVAAHGWDIAGAGRAGLQTAFVRRPGKFPFKLAKDPDLVVGTIEQLAKEL
ncbi:haloacid dehalogenase type II [uncultured Christiangramia sp.]|uniref:haloacid dehalogenase type II n=1 Tax=uncultured Christiangramia sp. TaxID=503836 RepID=UPI002628FCE4|nr:haloacid dehalogenase type II [uncultured Christiangramia sp.]